MLQEGMVKLPETLYKAVYEQYMSIISGMVISYYTKDFIDNDLTAEDIEIFHPEYIELSKYFRKYYKRDYDFTQKRFEFKINLNRNNYKLPDSYPPLVKGISTTFVISFDNKDIGGSITPYNDKATIEMTLQDIFTMYGTKSTGEKVYTMDQNKLKNGVSRLDYMLRHELMHFTQIYSINHKVFDSDYYDEDDSIDIVKYYTSEIEFIPTINSNAHVFYNKYSHLSGEDLKNKLRLFLSMDYSMLETSSFFTILKKNKPSKYKKAVKLFLLELEKIKKES